MAMSSEHRKYSFRHKSYVETKNTLSICNLSIIIGIKRSVKTSDHYKTSMRQILRTQSNNSLFLSFDGRIQVRQKVESFAKPNFLETLS